MQFQSENNRGSILTKLLITSTLVLIVAGIFVAVSAYIYYSSDLPNLKDITNYKPNVVNEIYSSDGKLIARFGLQKRILVNLDEIPDYVEDAFVSVEDKRFFEHNGIDFIGIMRALVENIKSGSVVAGGSTITQQVTKNLILSPERTLTRKIKEAILAWRIERNLTKQEILYLYLNHIYLGDGTYGIEAASRDYFGKPAKDLSIAEAAMLAGIPKLPEYYSPRKNLERSEERQKIVLELMKENGYINQEQYSKALDYKIKVVPDNNTYYQVAPYFVEYVRQHLENKVGEENYRKGGYKVITTLDVDMSLAAHWAVRRGIYEYEQRRGREFVIKKLNGVENISAYLSSQKKVDKGKVYQGVILTNNTEKGDINTARIGVGDLRGDFTYGVSTPLGTPVKGLNFPLSKKYAPLNGYNDTYILPQKLEAGDVIRVKVLTKFKDHITVYPVYEPGGQASLLSMKPNGDVVAMVGGTSFLETQFNRAVQAMRQPGSSFKPLVYSAALDKGYTETSILYDIPVIIKDWEPQNYDGKYDGAMILREAIARSRNLATIRMTMDIDPSYVADYASRFGFKSKLNPYPSIALGGSDVTLLEMVRSYNVFATGGELVKPRFIIRIYDRNGAIVEDNTDQEFILNEKLLKKEREERRRQILDMIAREKGETVSPEAESEEFIKEKDFADTDEIYSEFNFLTAEEFINILKKHSLTFNPHTEPKQIISPSTSYIVTDLLRTVITQGTGARAAGLNSLAPVAGKTGTTNDYTDAWFVGYSPKITTGVWVGKDNSTSLGHGETGARAALPIWMDYMKDALSDEFKGGSFDMPSGVKMVETPYGEIPYRKDSLLAGVLKDIKIKAITKNPGSKAESVNDVINDLKNKKELEKEKKFEDESEIDFLLRK